VVGGGGGCLFFCRTNSPNLHAHTILFFLSRSYTVGGRQRRRTNRHSAPVHVRLCEPDERDVAEWTNGARCAWERIRGCRSDPASRACSPTQGQGCKACARDAHRPIRCALLGAQHAGVRQNEERGHRGRGGISKCGEAGIDGDAREPDPSDDEFDVPPPVFVGARAGRSKPTSQS
jgi:hypothetical protein